MTDRRMKFVLSCICGDIASEAEEITQSYTVEEIRLRSDRPASYRVRGGVILSRYSMSSEQLANTVKQLCRGSVHAHEDEIKNGYIAAEGIRIGVCGRAVTEDEIVTGVSFACGGSLSIRFPFFSKNAADMLVSKIIEGDFRQSFLVYSPPGVGKTTVLRAAAYKISRKPHLKTVAICDCRGEIYDSDFMKDCLCDVYAGYPCGFCAECAVRTMAPDYIVCDEIGNAREAEVLLSVGTKGVPIIASAHAKTPGELVRRHDIRRIIENGVFDYLCGVHRTGDKVRLEFTKSEAVLG